MLLENIGSQKFHDILDIGCGTGNYTAMLGDIFGTSNITAVDISPQMVRIAKQKLQDLKAGFIIADAETASFDKQFDLITSNAYFQWLCDLRSTLVKYNRLLSEGGVMLFSLFGPDTFCELNLSIKKLHNKDIPISSYGFMAKAELKEILACCLDNAFVNEQVITETYDSLWDLLNTIKYTGTRGTGINGRYFTRDHIDRLQKIYRDSFGDLRATYQVFYCMAQKR